MDVQIPVDDFMSDTLKAAINYLNQHSASITENYNSLDSLETFSINNDDAADSNDEIVGQDVDLSEIDYGGDVEEIL